MKVNRFSIRDSLVGGFELLINNFITIIWSSVRVFFIALFAIILALLPLYLSSLMPIFIQFVHSMKSGATTISETVGKNLIDHPQFYAVAVYMITVRIVITMFMYAALTKLYLAIAAGKKPTLQMLWSGNKFAQLIIAGTFILWAILSILLLPIIFFLIPIMYFVWLSLIDTNCSISQAWSNGFEIVRANGLPTLGLFIIYALFTQGLAHMFPVPIMVTFTWTGIVSLFFAFVWISAYRQAVAKK